jgi:ketol-acid reductoisomerase
VPDAPAVYRDQDADPELLRRLRVAVIGFGNQGSAQAQNLRESGVAAVRVGNRDDDYAARAREAGFEVVGIAEAAAWGDAVLLLIPDEAQAAVVARDVAPGLRPGSSLVVASGYNVAFGLFELPDRVDVVMVAPRMIGAAVRDRYLRGEGYPCFVSVERDASGTGLRTALAIAHGIGGTRGGAIASSAREEAALDLFSEQAIWPALFAALGTAYEVMREAGFSDEAILNELYLSGEPAEVFDRIASSGLFAQLTLHSRTSQYGQLRGLLAGADEGLRARFRRILHEDILSGSFAREWSALEGAEPDALGPLRRRAEEQPIARAEARVRGRS